MTARVLVVNDPLPNLKLLDAKISNEYLEVETAINGADDFVAIETDPSDIVLLDTKMPGMDGF
tara:strand:- start:93 stop:281 length:189 start_codon:yes stop_codon:yes gene_type:complete